MNKELLEIRKVQKEATRECMYFDLKYGEIPIKVLFLEFDVLKNR